MYPIPPPNSLYKKKLEKTHDMKNRNFWIVLLLAASLCSCARQQVVERPRYTARTIDAFEISRIELNKENTVVFLDITTDRESITGFSDSVNLRVGERILPLVDAQGIRFPDRPAGNANLTDSSRVARLVFPALPQGTESVDLVFNYSAKSAETAFWDIELTPSADDPLRQVPASVREARIDPAATWKEPVFDRQHTRLDIHLLGYHPKMEYVHVVRHGFMPWHEEYAVGEDGIVNVEFDQYVTAAVEIEVGTRSVEIVVDPGEEATLYVDLRALNLRHSPYFPETLSRPVAYYDGKSRADLNRWLLSRQAPLHGDVLFTWNADTPMDAEGYARLCVDMHRKEIETLRQSNTLNAECLRYAELEALTNALERIQRIRTNFMDTYGYGKEDSRLPELSADCFRPLKDIGINTYDLLLLNTDVVKSAFFRYCSSADDVKAVFGEGYLADLFNSTRHCFQRFNNKLPLREEEMSIMRGCSPKITALCEKIYTEENKAWKAHLAKPGYRICEVPSVQDSSVLERILEKYRGRVVFVDFWGTACVPCVRAIKEMHPLKAEYKDKPVSFVFITSETAAPEEKWLQMIPDFGGDHYRLSRKQYKSLTKRFNIQFVPYYLLVDKQGNVVYQRTGFMGCPALKELLDKEIAK